ncbi:MAG: class II aldolase/adducin family protein [Bryobacterales bacterium]|nr:class II aldolase/adducin family protein [Bryobacterales bacterium]
MLKSLKEAVFEANIDVVRRGLVLFTWGNASGIDRRRGLVVIKPSGVAYETMRPADMVVVNLDGKVVEGKYKPSSDTPTHLVLVGPSRRSAVLYTRIHGPPPRGRRPNGRFPASAPRMRTTFGEPCRSTRSRCWSASRDRRMLHEASTGHAIVRRFSGLDPMATPAVLLAGHAPFVWGATPAEAAHNAVVLEEVATLAFQTVALQDSCGPIADCLRDKHFLRKHGSAAYYGQR